MKGDVRIIRLLKLLNKGDSLMRSLFEQKRFCGLISKFIAGSLLVGGIGTVNAQTSDEAIEEVIVTGIRASLQDAIAKKRNADDIRDVINAEDVGKLPDSNVAEALQRITGVQIGRSFGEGSEVSVRGIAANRIELNGQTQVGTGASRAVTTFSSLPAEMFSSLEVIKTPTADEVEGGLGAIIRLNTRKPLDGGDNLYVSGKLESLYSDRSGETAPGGSVYAKNAWSLDSGGRFGAVVNITKNDRKARQDYVRLKGWGPQNTGIDLDGNGVVENMVTNADGQIVALNDAAFAPLQTAFAANLQNRTNEAFRTTLQYEAEDGSDWTLDASLAKATREDQRYQHTTAINSRQITRDFRDVTYTENQTAIAGTVGNLRANGTTDRGTGLNIQASRAPYEGTTKTFALTHERMLSDRLLMTAQAAYGKGDQMNDQIYATVVWGQFSSLPYIVYDFASGNDLPTVVPHARTTDPLTDENRINYLDPTYHKLNGVLYQDQHEQNVDKAFKLDFDLDVDIGNINQVEFGMRIANRTGERYRNRGKDNQNNNSEGDGILGGLFFPALEEYIGGRMIVMPYGEDMFDGASGDFLRDYVAIDAGWMMTMGDEMETIGGTIKSRDNTWGFETEEDTQAIYAMANFEGVGSGGIFDGLSYSGNFGARYVKTDQTAFAYVLGGDGSFQPFEEDASYTNFLPSVNVSLALTDDLLLRVAAAKAMARAPMRDIAPMTTLFFFTQSGNIGNKDLVPEKVTQFDISLEYYIPDGGLISAAFFTKSYKDAIEDGFIQRCFTANPGEGEEVRDDGTNCPDSVLVPNSAGDAEIGSQIYYNLATKINAGSSKLKGFELAYDRPLDFMPYPFSNMGVQLNYTYTDSSLLQLTRTGYPVGLQDFSENSYNSIVYYEDDKFSARLAYNYRDDYYDNLTQANAAQFQKPYASLDGKVTYKINKKWDISLQAQNITNEAKEMYQEIEERLTDYTLNDTMIRLTLQGKL